MKLTTSASRPAVAYRAGFQHMVAEVSLGPDGIIRVSRVGHVGGRDPADLPDLTREDIRACLAFAADRERKLVSAPPE